MTAHILGTRNGYFEPISTIDFDVSEMNQLESRVMT